MSLKSTEIIDTFDRIHKLSVDDKFSTNVFRFKGNSSEIKMSNVFYLFNNQNNNQQEFHTSYPILTKYISNYVFYSGKYSMINHWDQSQDQLVDSFEKNLTQDNELSQIHRLAYSTKIDFDWVNRIFTVEIDANLRSKNTWLGEDVHWKFNSSPVILRSNDLNSESSCIVAKNSKDWNTKSIDLENNEVQYTRTGSETYLFTYRNDVHINGELRPAYKAFKIESQVITIQAENLSTIIIKEKNS